MAAAAGNGGAQQKESSYVTTGDEIPVEPGFMRGHGTVLRDGALIATVSGFVERVNKLVSVRALNVRYTGEKGDVVIGRVLEVADKRWRLDINARQHGVLLLSSVNLPGGVQRRHTDADSLQMRSLYVEDDLISAEVQQVMSEGAVFMHTRSLKYGKLENGQFITVPAALIKRTKQHFHSLPCGVDIILGLNGYVWLQANAEADAAAKATEAKAKAAVAATAGAPAATASTAASASASASASAVATTAAADPTYISATIRERICRVRNAILALAAAYVPIFADSVMAVYDHSNTLQIPAKDMVDPAGLEALTQPARDLLSK